METRDDATPSTARSGPALSALPSVGARVLAFALIAVAGACGGLIGWSFIGLQCKGACTTPKSIGSVTGALFFAVGTAVVAVLALRAMSEWKRIQDD